MTDRVEYAKIQNHQHGGGGSKKSKLVCFLYLFYYNSLPVHHV